MKGQSLLISALVFALLIAIFAVINIETVQVNFMFTKTSLPLILVILISTLLGGLTVGMLGILRQIRLHRTIKQLQRQVAELTADAELDASIKQADERPAALAKEEAFKPSGGYSELKER